ncbi:MAG: valine--tRNA ligase [Rickettsiales bacterium]|jgi:valyl-tRNA synthetase|nr:valine--tRNA ligase [Rickettsiales bacterium]
MTNRPKDQPTKRPTDQKTKVMLDKFDARAIEDKFIKSWESDGVYKFDPARPRSDTFAIDTPPPTVSGSLHMGHVMGYAQTDFIARYQRMCGKNVFFPIGWDDNGLPTERRVQNYFNIKCDPSLPYDPDFKPEHLEKFDTPQVPVSRRNFIDACNILIAMDERAFEDVWRRLGYSYDWSSCYSTISDIAISHAQNAFIKFYKGGNAKSIDAPTMWDTTFQTAVAQAEIEDREIAGFFHDIKFTVEPNHQQPATSNHFTIATTRPEFLPACIAVVAHPDDDRYKHLFGKNATVPLFGFSVPIMASEHADPEKGTGIMMVCTFGDAEDVKFWKTHGLPLKQIIGRDGRIINVNDEFNGLPVRGARKLMVEKLRASGDLIGEPRPIMHSVKFYEKGDVPIEFVPSRQWFVKLLDKKPQLIEQGRKIKWFPEHMRNRLENWTDGLNQDWAISRQRFFGVPFPVWYKLDAAGNPDFDNPILASSLPCDPMADTPAGFDASRRGQPFGFIGDPDVMDTWATSSLTPQIAMAMAGNPDNLALPFDMRNSGPEIIRTWNFYTIAQDLINENEIPWRMCCVNGWVLDPDRKKMSKSRGNVVVPTDIIEKFGSDAIRLWAAGLKWGTDAAFDENILEQKRKLVMKFFNAAKFVMGIYGSNPNGGAVFGNENEKQNLVCSFYSASDVSSLTDVDVAFWSKIKITIDNYKKYFNENDYTGALIETEQMFWNFCDNYLEIVKSRAYGDNKDSIGAKLSLVYAIDTFCKMFAPFMPFITDAVWQERTWILFKERTSVHVENIAIPEIETVDVSNYDALCELVSFVRGEKSKNNFSMKKPIARLIIPDNAFFRAAQMDIKNVLTVSELEFGGDIAIEWGE